MTKTLLPTEIPLKPGYYRAKWRIPADGTFEGIEMCPMDTWEIVQVNPNCVDWKDDPARDEALSVSVPGVRETQWRDCFVWGEFIAPLEPAQQKPIAPRGHWYNQFLDKQSEIFDLVRALKPVAREIAEKEHQALDDSWNPDYHIELTLSVRECRAIQELVKKHDEKPPLTIDMQTSPPANDARSDGGITGVAGVDPLVNPAGHYEITDAKRAMLLLPALTAEVNNLKAENERLTAALHHCRSMLEPMAKQIICPKDNPLRRAVDAIDEAMK